MAEYLRDTVVGVAPLTRRSAHSMLKRLRLWPMLAGTRGEPRLDIAAVCDFLLRAGELGMREGPLLHSVDMNAVLVRQEGKGVIVVDAKAVLGPSLTRTAAGN